MIRVAGVGFKDTKPGKANPTRISSDEFEDKYLIAAGTKRKSSFLVVDTNGFLRRGSVKQAWDHRNNTDRDVTNQIRRLARYFDDSVIPDQEMNANIRTIQFDEAKTVAGVSFSDTTGGKLDESAIPDDGFESHYLYPEDTKDESSYPVVDGENNLRRGNVESAWELGGQGAPVSEEEHDEKVKMLGKQFDDNPVPGSAYEGESKLHIEETLAMSASAADGGDLDFEAFEDRIGTGFNEFGVRENRTDDGELKSVDVIFEAMEPGPPERRNGVRITEDFLREVASKDYSDPNKPPHLVDHQRSDSFSKVGDVKEVWFSESRGKLMLMARVPNTGSRTHDEAIKRYTHEPPSWRNGSVGFGDQYKAVRNESGEPELRDGTLQEFSTVNFPGGYDEGGIRPDFAEAAQEAVVELGGDFAMDKERVFEEWKNLVNMSEEEMEMWDEHPCSDVGTENGSDWRDNTLMLMGQAPDGWNEESYRIANRVIAWANEHIDKLREDAKNAGRGTCPSPLAVEMLNRGINPFDEMPGGNPTFYSTEVITFGE